MFLIFLNSEGNLLLVFSEIRRLCTGRRGGGGGGGGGGEEEEAE